MNYLDYLALGCFLIAVIIALQPIYVYPRLKVQIYGTDDHDNLIINLLSVVSIILLISKYSKLEQLLHLDKLDEFADNGGFFATSYFGLYCSIILFFVACIYGISLYTLRLFTDSNIKKQSIRPFYCLSCRKKLKQLKAEQFLNEKHKVAQKIGSIKIEIWHCPNCYPQINEKNIHQRNYVVKSN